jgi:hypothetical protein
MAGRHNCSSGTPVLVVAPATITSASAATMARLNDVKRAHVVRRRPQRSDRSPVVSAYFDMSIQSVTSGMH